MDDGRAESTERRLRDEGLPSPGTLIAEYRITKPIGVGGCGAVFQAYQERLDRDLALKVLLPSAAERFEGLAKRFLREIDIVKRLEHPNIVRLYDYGQSDSGLLWMAMELVRGRELTALLGGPTRLDPSRVRHLMLQVLSALAEAHELSIVHRDLKPGNIMLTRKGADEDVVKLLDFGIGKALGEGENSAVHNLTAAHGDAYGTPRYMAPELLLKEDIGPHSDVYSIGLILFECITGSPAVIGDTVYEILAKQLSSPLEMPPWLAATQLGEVIKKSTEKEWRQRYPSALEFHRALRAVDLDDVYRALGHQAAPSQGGASAAMLAGTAQTPQTAQTVSVGVSSPLTPSTGPLPGALPSPLPAPVPGPNPPLPQFRTATPGLLTPTPGQPLTPVPGQPLPVPPVAAAAAAPPAIDDDPTSAAELKALMGNRAGRSRNIALAAGAALLLVVVLVVVLAGGEDTTPDAAADSPDETVATEPPTALPEDPSSFPMVEWAFESTPAGAEVQVNGRLVCDATPCTADIRQLERSVTVIMSLPEYRAVSRSIVPSQAGSLAVEFQSRLAPEDMLPKPAPPDAPPEDGVPGDGTGPAPDGKGKDKKKKRGSP